MVDFTAVPIHVTLQNLINSKKEDPHHFEINARKLADYAAQQEKYYFLWRIAKELQDIDCDTQDIEQYILSSRNPIFIFRYAREIKFADIKALQKAIEATRNYNWIARFACYVNGADTKSIEKLIIDRKCASAAYIYMRDGLNPNIDELKSIFFKSKKPRYLYALAHFITDPKELELIENLIIASHSEMYVRLYASKIKGANISKLENRVLHSNNLPEMKKFATSVPKADKLRKYLLLTNA